MTTLDAKMADWLRHPSSSPGLTPKLFTGAGPLGGITNALKFGLSASAARQRAAYVNQKLGVLRGWGLFATSVYFSTGGDGDAFRTRAGVLARWSSALLDAIDLCYVAELLNDDSGDVHLVLREGPNEDGNVLLQEQLASGYGFAPGRWMEVGLAFETDTVGNVTLVTLARSNGVVGGHTTFDINGTSWYTVGSVPISRYAARASGAVGFQIVAAAGEGYAQIGHFRALTTATPSYTLLTDDITA